MKKRIMAILLCLCIVAVLLPTTAFAAGGGAIQLGAGGIAKDNRVYFGQKGTTVVPWIALDDSGFLLSEYTIGTSSFRDLEDWGYYNYSTVNSAEDSSNLKEVMDGLYNGSGTTLFSDLEQGAVKETTLAGNSMCNGIPDVPAHLFPLSYDEAANIGWGDNLLKAKSIDAPEGSAGWWWLRSSLDLNIAFCVDEDGSRSIDHIDSALGVRPAFNLNLNSVLFTSAAVGGKSSGAVGAAALNSVSTTTPTEWKLTLLDDDRNFSAATTAVTGDTLTLSYSGAATGANEYISAIIKDNSGNITHYGRLKNTTAAADASGTVNIDLSGIDMTGKTLCVFSEQYNGGENDDTKLTDYASELVEVSQTKNAYAITNNLMNISTDNAEVYRLMGETADYTATLTADISYTLPATITVEVGGAALTPGTDYTYSGGSLTIPAVSITGDIAITAAGVAPHAHLWATAWTTNATHHWHECETAGCTVTDNSAKDGYGAHTAGDWIIDTNATASTNGSKHKECTACGYVMETAAIPATGGTGGGGGDTTDYYTLTFDTNGGSSISSITRAEYTTIDLTLDRYIPTREGWAFTGWYSDAALKNKIVSIRLTRNTTIYAGWEDKTNPNTGFENPFTDVSENDWFFEDVMFAFVNKLMIGTSDTTFSPYGTTTRAMVATTIWRMEGEPDATGANGFIDVENGKWYTEAILWAAENEIAEGYGGGLFGTNDPVTREQLAAMFYRYAEYKGYDTTITGSIDRFTDKGDISDWAARAMKWAVGYGLIQGKDNNILDPKGYATRAEFAAMLHRFIEKNELEEGITATGLMGWIDPRRILPPQTGDASTSLWTSALLFSLAACAVLTLLKRRRDGEEAEANLIHP